MNVKVSSITLLDKEESKTRAIATLLINNEFAVHGVKVIEGKNGEFVQMPQKRDKSGEYHDIVFPISAEVREQINSAVLERYKNPISFDEIQLIGSYETKCDIPENERVTVMDKASQIYAESTNAAISQLQAILTEAKQFAVNIRNNEEISELSEQEQNENEKVRSRIHAYFPEAKSSGQIVIDDSLVVTGIRVIEENKKQPDKEESSVKKTFVSMPSYPTETGDYRQYAHPITRACYDKINRVVTAAYKNVGRYTYKGVQFAELGEKENVSCIAELNNKFAAKLMEELDRRKIPYHAKISETTVLFVRAYDKEAADNARKELNIICKSNYRKTGGDPK